MHLCVCFCAKVIVALVPMATLSSRRRQHLQLYPALLGYLTSRLPVGVWKTLGCCHHCPAQRVVYHGRPALDHKVSLDIFVGINASPEHDHNVSWTYRSISLLARHMATRYQMIYLLVSLLAQNTTTRY